MRAGEEQPQPDEVLPREAPLPLASSAPAPAVGVAELPTPVSEQPLPAPAPPPIAPAPAYPAAPVAAPAPAQGQDENGANLLPADMRGELQAETAGGVAGAGAAAGAGAPDAAKDENAATKFIWPVNGGKLLDRFGARPDGSMNDGVNIAAEMGEPIWAAADGDVIYADDALRKYGNMVILRHPGGWMTAYAHTSSITVKKGDHVLQGQLIAYVGTSGGVKTPQLHFVLRSGRKPVDPEQYLPPSPLQDRSATHQDVP
jgi:murein DD-endopeptidase MepM/ murein hydrolase activator NlpD